MGKRLSKQLKNRIRQVMKDNGWFSARKILDKMYELKAIGPNGRHSTTLKMIPSIDSLSGHLRTMEEIHEKVFTQLGNNTRTHKD